MAGHEIAVATGAIALFQYLAGSVAITIAQTVFENELGPALSKHAAGVEVQYILDAGATGFRAITPADQLTNVQIGYNEALVKVFVSNGVPLYKVLTHWLIVSAVHSHRYCWPCVDPELWLPMDEDWHG